MKKLIRDIEKIVAPALPALELPAATDWRVLVNRQSGTMRVMLIDKDKKPLAYFDCNAPDAYAFATRILFGYDTLEGIK